MDESHQSQPAGDGYSEIRFSTEDYPPEARLEAWREIYWRGMQKLDVEPVSDEPLYTEATLRNLPDLKLNMVRRSGVVHHRRRECVSHDDVGLTIGVTSAFEARQRGASAVLGAGEAIVLTGAEPALVRAPSFGDYIHLRVPIGSLAPLVADLDAAYGRHVPAQNGALGLLTRYVRILDESDALAERGLRRQAVAHVHDLLALAIGATDDGREVARLRGGRAARLAAMKSDIAARLSEPSLSVAAIARLHGVQPRCVQRLFEADGTTFTEYLLEQRLALAYRLLRDPLRGRSKVSTIALDAGFGDLSYFNRSFRRRFGATPSDLRGASRDG